MEHGEAASLGRYFSRQLKENPSYYFATQLDCEELITNIFWADARMIIEYSHFGDVITFDTTYSTNRDARPLGVFLGLNHHRETVVFGGALLYDETIESFVWLFETFLEAMSEKKPITIFTDQDAAMSAAIKEVMPKTYHALCSWHMWQNAEKHLGHLLKNDSQFNDDLLACIYEYDGEDEFLTAWNEMLDKHGLKVLDVLDIKLIPNRYITKRWRRDAKDGSGNNCTTHNIKPDTRLEYVDRNCKTNVEEDIIRPSTDFADKEDELCASITIVPKGIKKREIYRNKKRRPKSWIENIPKPKGGTSKKQIKKRKVREEVYAHDVMAQKKTEDISSGNITSFTQLLMSASTSSPSHQGGSSASVALTSHLESISSVVGSNDKINGSGGSGGLLTQGSVASGGPLTQESVTSGWNELVHKFKPFF
ncbi:hypothetical protein SO802_023551 [Lithocarpus litseifolius]|uniref:MULE transposase domain-containing protein n=1 Tax=Lithocarpus litseifolius TaxID=425828 RepID=A0AAW2C779_9ROSI